MRRYTPQVIHKDNTFSTSMLPIENGEWCRWHDAMEKHHQSLNDEKRYWINTSNELVERANKSAQTWMINCAILFGLFVGMVILQVIK